MSEAKQEFPQPLGNLVVIRNPLLAKREAMDKILKNLPETEKDKYLMENMVPEFDAVEVLATGPKCNEVEAGKKYAVKMESAVYGRLTTSNMNYLYIRETEFFGVW